MLTDDGDKTINLELSIHLDHGILQLYISI